jgi:hypothetical protein
MSTAAQTATIPSDLEAAREAFIARFDDLSAAMAFETHVLGIGREFLPECALAVRDNQDAATVEYYAWLLEQANEAHDAADGDESEDAQAEDARLLAEVERAYEAAKGQWTGRSWDDGDKVTPETTNGQIAALLASGEPVAVTCWGVDESNERYRRQVRRALELLQAAWADDPAGAGDVFASVCDTLRALAAESDAAVTFQAHVAETSAAEALSNARRGFKHTALVHAEHAATAERQFGDAPTWGPFCDAVRAWSEHGE